MRRSILLMIALLVLFVVQDVVKYGPLSSTSPSSDLTDLEAKWIKLSFVSVAPTLYFVPPPPPSNTFLIFPTSLIL